MRRVIGRTTSNPDLLASACGRQHDLVLTALINFVVIAAVIYFLVVAPMNALNERIRRGKEDEPEDTRSDEVLLLTEIRDALRQRD